MSFISISFLFLFFFKKKSKYNYTKKKKKKKKNTKMKKVDCPTCFQKIGETYLDRHILLHKTTYDTFPCKVCNIYLGSLEGFALHNKYIHPKTIEHKRQKLESNEEMEICSGNTSNSNSNSPVSFNPNPSSSSSSSSNFNSNSNSNSNSTTILDVENSSTISKLQSSEISGEDSCEDIEEIRSVPFSFADDLEESWNQKISFDMLTDLGLEGYESWFEEQQNNKELAFSTKNINLFPSLEAFLFYLLYQQEGASRIPEKFFHLLFLVLHDKRLDLSKIPRNLDQLKKIDKEVKDLYEGKIEKKKLQKLEPKLSNRKTPVIPVSSSSNINQSSLVESKVEVSMVTIESRLKMLLSNPILNKTIILEKSKQHEGSEVREFIDSPMASMPGKFTNFYSYGDFEILDDCEFESKGKKLFGRIIEFLYVPNTQNETIDTCIKACLFRKNGKDIVLDQDKQFIMSVDQIKKKILVSSKPLNGYLYCCKQLVNGIVTEFDPNLKEREKKILYSGELNGKNGLLFISIFFDSYVSAPTRYKSTGGLYMSVMNMKIKDQRKLENIYLLSLIPHSVDWRELWEFYRLELVKLEKDGFSINVGKENNETFKVRLGLFKADSPQRCELLDHYGVTANLICPRCKIGKKDIWDSNTSTNYVMCHHYRKGFLEALELLKREANEKTYNKILEKYGFHGKTNLFKELSFDPFLQVACEPYHLLFLGILKFYFRQLITFLSPYQRDIVNALIKQFPYPRGMPHITFAVMTDQRNFSISFTQQIISGLPYILHQMGINEAMVQYWFDLSSLVQLIFLPSQSPQNLPKIKQKYLDLFERGKKLFVESITTKPQNIHNLVEFIWIDLEIWISAHIMSGAKEEQKHQIYKGGARYTNPSTGLNSLVQRDVSVSVLRHLLHGGLVKDEYKLDDTFRKFSHPSNEFEPHPLLLTITNYLEVNNPLCFPRKFINQNGRRARRELSLNDKTNIAQVINTSSQIPDSALLAKQFVIEETVYEVGDCIAISVTGSSLIKDRSFLELTEIINVEYLNEKGEKVAQVLFKGKCFQVLNKKLFGKNIYQKLGLDSSWQVAKSAVKIVLLHHACSPRCKVERSCPSHQDCTDSCQHSMYLSNHCQEENTWFIEEDFRNLSC